METSWLDREDLYRVRPLNSGIVRWLSQLYHSHRNAQVAQQNARKVSLRDCQSIKAFDIDPSLRGVIAHSGRLVLAPAPTRTGVKGRFNSCEVPTLRPWHPTAYIALPCGDPCRVCHVASN
jgi:hypothetical protein